MGQNQWLYIPMVEFYDLRMKESQDIKGVFYEHSRLICITGPSNISFRPSPA